MASCVKSEQSSWNDPKLWASAHIIADSCTRNLWEYYTLKHISAGTPNRISGSSLTYMNQLKSFWHPSMGRLEIPENWSRLILPAIPKYPSHSDSLKRADWLNLSLLSAALSSIKSDLFLVPTVDLIARSRLPDYCGPQFPLEGPPGHPNIQVMFDLLMYEGSPRDAVLCVASCFAFASDFQLKMDPQIYFPTRFGDVPQVDFACAPEWNTTSPKMLRRSQDAPLRVTSPALTIGICLKDNDTADGLSSEELKHLALAAQPHLEMLLVTWNVRYPDSSPDSTVCIFVLALRGMHIFIVAHIPYLCGSEFRYQSIVVDRLRFPPRIPGTDDREGMLDRLRLAIALLTIKNHTGRLASLCHDVVWPRAVFDEQLELVQQVTGTVTSQSQSGDEGKEAERDNDVKRPKSAYPSPLVGEDDEDDEDDDDEDMDTTASGTALSVEIETRALEIAHSKDLVNNWLKYDGEILDPIIDLAAADSDEAVNLRFTVILAVIYIGRIWKQNFSFRGRSGDDLGGTPLGAAALSGTAPEYLSPVKKQNHRRRARARHSHPPSRPGNLVAVSQVWARGHGYYYGREDDPSGSGATIYGVSVHIQGQWPKNPHKKKLRRRLSAVETIATVETEFEVQEGRDETQSCTVRN
ncbi:hypothetical protein C8R43DRAFT_948906 [Mycena crocata]|nr:hypothetical protein C8R43DRAFT_948906 [Mycena crocata]